MSPWNKSFAAKLTPCSGFSLLLWSVLFSLPVSTTLTVLETILGFLDSDYISMHARLIYIEEKPTCTLSCSGLPLQLLDHLESQSKGLYIASLPFGGARDER